MQFADLRAWTIQTADRYTGEDWKHLLIATDEESAARRASDLGLYLASVAAAPNLSGGDLHDASCRMFDHALRRFRADLPFVELSRESCRSRMASQFDSRVVRGARVGSAVGCSFAAGLPDRVYTLAEAVSDPPLPFPGKCNREPRGDGLSWCACDTRAVLIDL